MGRTDESQVRADVVVGTSRILFGILWLQSGWKLPSALGTTAANQVETIQQRCNVLRQLWAETNQSARAVPVSARRCGTRSFCLGAPPAARRTLSRWWRCVMSNARFIVESLNR